MYSLKNFQEKAVSKLLEHTFEALGTQDTQIPILLEAPTGAGKTVMMATCIERIMEELPLQVGLHPDVAFVWFAPNTLHEQSFDSLRKMYSAENKLNCLKLEDLGTSPMLNAKDLLFINWSKVDSETNIWRKDNETKTNLETLVQNTHASNTTIILIIDEAHLSAFTGKQAVAVRRLMNAKVEILVTATPNMRPQRNVFISRQEVISEQMIKKKVRLNKGLDPTKQNSDNIHVHLLKTAFEKRNELQALYDLELGENIIKPLIIIQLPSESASLSDEDKNIRDVVEKLLEVNYEISTNNGRLAVWLSDTKDKKNLEDLEKINGFQDVLIFKQAIAQGWDCPRATILVSYRNVKSPNFGIQTVGRILRMPHQKHYQNDALNYGYVYTDIPSNKIVFVPSDVDYFNIQTAKRNPDIVFDKLENATIVNDRQSKGLLTNAFQEIFFKVMEKEYGVVQLGEIALFTTTQELEDYEKQKIANKKTLSEKFWVLSVDIHQIKIPVDIEIDPYAVSAVMLGADQMRGFAVTITQLGVFLDRFCFENITRLNRSKSWKMLKTTLIHFVEYYLGLDEFDTRKICLHPENKSFLIKHIAQALENFDVWQKEQGNKNRRIEYPIWEVPLERDYNENYNKEEVKSHALQPFFEYEKASNPEKIFKDFLIQNEGNLEWWYKNGDSGKEHFAVPYELEVADWHLFYVDFVVKFKSGKIALFDTKTPNSDATAAKKHNALITYIETQNKVNKNGNFFGGILIPEMRGVDISFRYCKNRIENTTDLTGWEFLKMTE